MKIIVAAVTTRAGKAKLAGISSLADEYLNRSAQYCKIEVRNCISEEEFFVWIEGWKSRTAPFLVLLDSRGKQSSSEEFAEFIERHRSGASQELIFAIGPADGWSKGATMRCNLLLSLGRVTLPHELAKVVLLEQIYRAFAILNHHPYHGGH